MIIDALLGIGATGSSDEPLSTCIAMANSSRAQIIAADIPTPGMRADRICAFHRAKTEGSEVIDIGIPVEAECCVGPGDLTMLPSRRKKAHKGYGGKCWLSVADLTRVHPTWQDWEHCGQVRISSVSLLRSLSPFPTLIYERLEGERIGEEHLERLMVLAARADAVICGNGLGPDSHAVMCAIAPCCKKAVIDADALRLPLPVAQE